MFEKICGYFDGQRGLAKRLGVTEAAVSIWKRDGIPAGRAIEIERISNGTFKATEITRNA